MSDPNPGGPATQFRSLLRSFVLDPTLLLTPGLDAPRLARIVAEHAGPTRDRIFTPWSPWPPSSGRSSATTTPARPPSLA